MIIGITGSFGTGKTTVAKIFERLGAYVIDADRITHRIIPASSRARIAKIVFRRRAYLELLCRIIHPIVINKIKQQIKSLGRKRKNIVIDAPLLIEAGLDKIVDILIVVKASRKIQIERVMKRTRLSKSEVLKRIRSQLALRKKINLADYVIDNSDGRKNTERQVWQVWQRIKLEGNDRKNAATGGEGWKN
jgi:dephospho-CoA kinase